MVLVTARAKPRDGWSTSLRNQDDDDSSDGDDSSSSPSAAAARGQGSDWDWNWSSDLIDIGLVDEPPQLRFVETPFTLAKRNALTKRAAAETDTVAYKNKEKKLATTPAASAAASKVAKPSTTPAPRQPAALTKKQDSSPPPADVHQQAVPPISSQAPSPLKDSFRATPIAQQQSHDEAPSSKARLISSSRFRPASTSSPTVFASSNSSQPPSSSTAIDKTWLATATAAETETDSDQAPPAAGLATTKRRTARVEQSSGTTVDTPPRNRLPQAASSTYPLGTGGSNLLVHKVPPNLAKIPTLPCSSASSEPACAPATTKEDASDNDADESLCLPPPPLPRRHRGEEKAGCSAAIGGAFAAPVNVDSRIPSTPKPNKTNAIRRPPPPPPLSSLPMTNLPLVSPLDGRRRPLKLQQQSFPEQEEEEDDATRLAIASSSNPQPQQQRARDSDGDVLLPQAIKAPRSSSSSAFSTAGPASSSGETPSFSSMTTTTTESDSLRTMRGHREGISPETRRRLDRFKRVGNFSSSALASASAAAAAAAQVETDPGRLLLPLSRRGDNDDGPSLEPSTPVPDRFALQSGGPVSHDVDSASPRSSTRKVLTSTTKFSLPGLGTGGGSLSSQMKKKRSRLDFTPDVALEVFQQKKKKKKKNAHGPSSSSSLPSPTGNDAWNVTEPVSPSPVFTTGGPFQERQQRPQPRRETIVLGAAVRSVRPVSLATTAASTGSANYHSNLGTSSSSSLPKRQPSGFKRPLAAARTRGGNFIIRGDDDDDDQEGKASTHESEDARRRRLYRSLGL